MNRLAAQLSFILLLALTFTGVTNKGWAQENRTEPWTLEADRIIHHSDPQQIIAEGDVILHHQEEDSDIPLKIKADTVTYRSNGSELEARGNVFMEEEGGTILADTMRLNLQNRTGSLTSTSISLTDQKLTFSGSLAEKIAEDRYIFYDGTVTSCQTEDDKAPDWSINWRKADITVDGTAFLKHATFKVKKMPLLYIPYLPIPAKVTRQTGFLFPEISHSSRDGTGWIAPFFINLSPSSDLTFYPGYYDKRGVFAGLEFRQVTDTSSRATLSINYQQDRTEDPGPAGSEDDYRQDGYLRAEHDRYWIRGKADRYFSHYSVLRLDIDAVSDQDFLHEYREGITGFSQNNQDFLHDFNRGLQEASLNFRESILQYVKRGQLGSGGLEVRYVDDALADFTDTDPIQTLPRALYSSRVPLDKLPLNFGWDSEYVYYRPEEGIGYQRLDLSPRLVMPTPFGDSVEGTIIGGFRETIYQVENIGSPASSWDSTKALNRNAWEFSTNVAAILARDFHFGAEQQLTHTFRPNLRYDYLDSGNQEELPDLDDIDRLSEANDLTIELNNYFQAGNTDQTTTNTRQVGYLKFSQSYDLSEARRTLIDTDDKHRPFSELTMDLEIAPTSDLFLRYQTALDVYGAGISSYSLQSRYSNSRQDNLTIDYDYVQGGDRDLNLSAQLRITAKITASYSTTVSLLDDHVTDESIGLLYNSQCWGVELTSSRDSGDQRLMLTFSLTGIGTALEVEKSGV